MQKDTKRPALRTRKITDLVDLIANRRPSARGNGALLVAISGIDASGKTTVAGRVAQELGGQGFNVALIGLDPWHQPQTIRLNPTNPAQHFYRHAFRWDEFFDLLVNPLVRDRSVTLTAQLIEVARDSYYAQTYRFRDVDIVILEGIFLLKKEFRRQYDLAFWTECSFETALQRAIRRNQVSKQGIIADYESIYFPAQKIHFAKDNPTGFVDAVYLSDRQFFCGKAMSHGAG